MSPDRARTHFGYREIALDEKQTLVDDVFHSVAQRYDLMNDLMSMGLHRAWKDALVTAVNPPRRGAFNVLDIAGGTGDIALRLVEAGSDTCATVVDINPDMLEVGRARMSRAAATTRSAAASAISSDRAGCPSASLSPPEPSPYSSGACMRSRPDTARR